MSSYWQQHKFTPYLNEATSEAFDRLCATKRWKYRQMYKQREQCYEAEYNHYFHAQGWSEEGKLEVWQQVCELVGQKAGSSITQCKKILSRKYVNLVDLLDAMSTGSPVRVFHNYAAFQQYNAENHRIFPMRVAKSDGFIRVFMRRFF